MPSLGAHLQSGAEGNPTHSRVLYLSLDGPQMLALDVTRATDLLRRRRHLRQRGLCPERADPRLSVI